MTRSTKIGLTVGGLLIFVFATIMGIQIYQSGIWRGPDAQFGDQHLKTTVALVELHRTRYGRYPGSLNEIKFTGAWDGIALHSVSYVTNEQRTKYCVEVQRGWVGKPTLSMPSEYWQGTGFDESLCR